MFEAITSQLKNLSKEIAAFPALKGNVQAIDEIVQNVDAPLLIMVMGEFSTGKSTFINALVGEAIAKVNAKPTTAVITRLTYGAEDGITVFFRDGTQKGYDAESFARLTAEADDEANRLHEKIDYVERRLPIDILKNMSIIDSPGLNAIKSVHEETTRRFMDKADTVLWLFDANQPVKPTEIEAMKRLNPRLSPVVIVNKIDGIDEDAGESEEAILSAVERKLCNNNLEVQKVIGISAKQAYQGSTKDNEKLTEASNIAEFYRVIETEVLPNKEKYKRNSMLDGLAKVVFSIGNELSETRQENDRKKDEDYAAYIETEQALASVSDALEDMADAILDDVESRQTSRRKKFSTSEKLFYGVLHWLGLFVEKDNAKAQQYLEDAAVRNDTAAQFLLADVYRLMGNEDKADYWQAKLGIVKKKTAKPERKAAPSEGKTKTKQQDSPSEMLDKGIALEKTQKYAEAMQWYRKAADAGDATAMDNLGSMYENGKGTAQDYAEAMQWYRKAADAGNATAMNNLGSMYEDGKGAAQDYAEAMQWYRKAADAGNVTAMVHLGYMYDHGEGVEQNYAEAMKWYHKAAEKGYARAMNILGYMYRNGLGVEQDYAEAMKWYHKAAEKGYARAMNTLGHMYRNGKGIEQDYATAMKWYRKAAEAGVDNANVAIKNLEKEINASKQKKSCFITTAVCGSLGKPDDCHELAAFRSFRDNWLSKQKDGAALISDYYRIAPTIVAHINQCGNAEEIYRGIWEQHLRPCLAHIEQGDSLRCKECYMEMVRQLWKKYSCKPCQEMSE